MRKTRNLIKGNGNDGLEAEHLALITKKTQLELEIKELEESLLADKNLTEQYTKELVGLQQRIVAVENDLENTIIPKYELAQDVMQRYSREKLDATKKMEGLYARQGRGRQFRTQEDRDAFLHKQIAEIQISLTEKKQELSEREDKIASLRRSIQNEEKAIETKKSDIAKKSQMLSSLTANIDNKKREMSEFAEERKSHWRSLEDLEERLKEAGENVNRYSSDLRKSMPHATAMGIEALKQIVIQENIPPQSYLGPVVENLQLVDPKFQTVVEVAAQNALFHVIVDTDSTAARLMNHLERKKLGRVTFLPMNRLKNDTVRYPDSEEVLPLLSRCIRYDPSVEKAMNHIFAKKLLAKSVEAASSYSISHNMDAITLDGDLCSRKGALSGGYIDRGQSKLKAFNNLKEARCLSIDLENQARNLRRKATAVDQQISSLVAETERLEGKHTSLLRNLEQMGRELETSSSQNEIRKKQCAEQSEALPKVQEEVHGIESMIVSLQQEIGTILSDQLSEGEREMLHNLQRIVKELDKEIEAQTFALEEVSLEKQRVESLLADNLLKQKRDLENAIACAATTGDHSELAIGMFSPRNSRRTLIGSETTAAHRKRQLEVHLRELEDTERLAQETSHKLATAQQEEDKDKKEIIATKAKLDDLKLEDSACAQALEEAKEMGERLMNKVIAMTYIDYVPCFH
jgi:structural maintenance of chromosome 3 (chondroitin sulfate proteoglycan 6)